MPLGAPFAGVVPGWCRVFLWGGVFRLSILSFCLFADSEGAWPNLRRNESVREEYFELSQGEAYRGALPKPANP